MQILGHDGLTNIAKCWQTWWVGVLLYKSCSGNNYIEGEKGTSFSVGVGRVRRRARRSTHHSRQENKTGNLR